MKAKILPKWLSYAPACSRSCSGLQGMDAPSLNRTQSGFEHLAATERAHFHLKRRLRKESQVMPLDRRDWAASSFSSGAQACSSDFANTGHRTAIFHGLQASSPDGAVGVGN